VRGRRLAAFPLLLLWWALVACDRAPLHHQEAFVFGTRVEVMIAALPETQARQAAAAVLREFDRLHRTYHAWKPSELSSLNAAIAAGKRQPVSQEMSELIAEAQRLTRLSDGLFDPGIGRLISLWGFQSDDLPVRLPDAAALAAWVADRPSIVDLRLDDLHVSSPQRQLALDFGGYLKGVALDRAVSILQAQGAHNALINIGGNVMVLGSRNGQRWRVGIQHPRQAGPLATLELADGEAIGTSGDYQRYFELDGRRYSHLLDPRSGQPVFDTQAVTVLITPRRAAGTLSDVASKPLFIAGRDWPRLARRLQVGHVLRVDAQGGVQLSQAMQRRIEYVARPVAIEVIP